VSLWSAIIPPIAAGGTAAWGTFHPRSQLFGRIIKSAGEFCALTFDDGPNPRVTPRLLKLLGKYRVPATFFVLGKHAAAEPGLVAEIAAGNHKIGNHTYSHPSLVFYSRQAIIDELKRCDDAVFRAVGKNTECVRPPFGFRGPQFFSAARTAGFSEIMMWTVNGRDWKRQSASDMQRRLKKVAAGDVVLLHDGNHHASNIDREHMLQALEYWLPRWKDSGLQFTSQVADTQRVKMVGR
jgi:peptidoglycan-N-acetylglucosamine deacetylase